MGGLALAGGAAGQPSGPAAGAGGQAMVVEPLGVPSLTPGEGIWTSVRDQANPLVLSFQLDNPGPGELVVEAIDIVDTELFVITDAPELPAAVAAGGSIDISVQLVTAEDDLPMAPEQDNGSTVAAGSLAITAGGETLRARLHGIILTTAIFEPTFGQVLDALGYNVNIGNTLRTNANPDAMPGIQAGTDEIDAPLFVRAGPGQVSVRPVARFSPLGVMPFGFYAAGNANARTEVGAMDEQDDPHTSDKARIVLPPVTGSTTFDPGDAAFGIWAFTNQVEEGNPQHGNQLYTEDDLNVTATPHRVKVYPLKDAAGVVIEDSYLLGCEEAANGDYQDYVFVLSNVTPAP